MSDSAEKTVPAAKAPRLDSLDALRGFDLFALTMLGPVAHVMTRGGLLPEPLANAFSHVAWRGFNCWDMVMPLFLFMAGVSIPFAMAKFRAGADGVPAQPMRRAHLRIAKRVLVLWLLGAAAQGNLLAFDAATFKPLSNTLQAIAIGYAGAALLFLHCRMRAQIAVAGALLCVSWLACALFGDWNPDTNLPERLDELLLGRWTDGARVAADGSVVFAPWYHYAWIFPSLNFVATVASGVFTGALLKNAALSPARKFFALAGTGAALACAGWALDWCGIAPVIKPIWTSSMVLVTSGYGMLLMAAFFGVMDWAGCKRGSCWLKLVGMNSVLAYMLSPEVGLVSFDGVSRPLLRGFARFTEPAEFEALVACGNALVLFLILWLCARAKVFLKA